MIALPAFFITLSAAFLLASIATDFVTNETSLALCYKTGDTIQPKQAFATFAATSAPPCILTDAGVIEFTLVFFFFAYRIGV